MPIRKGNGLFVLDEEFISDEEAGARLYKESGVQIPLFRQTSCAVVSAHRLPDYNGHRRMATTISRLIDLIIMLIDQSTLNNHWNHFEYVSLDLEGTGPQHWEREGIVDIAGVLILDGRV